MIKTHKTTNICPNIAKEFNLLSQVSLSINSDGVTVSIKEGAYKVLNYHISDQFIENYRNTVIKLLYN